MVTLVSRIALVAATASLASAQDSIYIDFSSTSIGGVAGTPTASAGAAVGVAGTWNDLDVPSFAALPFVSIPLLDANGSASTVTATFEGVSNATWGWINFDEPNTLGDDQALLDDGMFFDEPGTITFDNLAPGSYDVYTYAMAPDEPFAVTSVDVVGSTGVQLVGGDFAAGYVMGDTHALHTVMVDTTGQIVINTEVSTTFDSILGIQVVPEGTTGSNTIGMSFCTANNNSTGFPGFMTATGSDVASANNVTLHANDLPPGQFGIFVVGVATGMVNVNSGVLCLSGDIGRYQEASQIFQVNPAGVGSLMIDLTMIPTPMTFLSASAGDTFYFQGWHRDLENGNQTSNFTAGLQIDFL